MHKSSQAALPKLVKFGMRPPDVIYAFGNSRELYETAVRAGLLKPVISGHRMRMYDAGDVAVAWARIKAGELENFDNTNNVQD